MLRPLVTLSLLFLSPVLMAQAPSSPKPATSKADLSQEAAVIELFFRHEKFENDGTSSRQDMARMRIQSGAGVQQYGVLSFSYASGTGTFEVSYVRVRKPDGSVVETPPENVQDMAAQITREAPFYSDLHEKHVAVKGLSVGDVLEYRIEERTTKPLAPGQFWTSYAFTHEQIVLDEQLEINVPGDRTVKVKSTTVQPVITEAGGRHIYTWHSTNLQHKDETNAKREATRQAWEQERGRLRQPDVLMSSFATWEDVGRWYGGLQDDRVKPTPEITAKAAELTRNAPTDEDKIRVLYAFVSTQFHYVGVALGIGRYQPHSAGDVLANQYGDCKDKHTLLASLLTASGIPAYPGLISSSRQVDEQVPSPGQFDHVITIVPRGNSHVWLDTTVEVGPYQYLAPNLRDKQALAIWKDKPSALVRTPADLPYASTQVFNMDAKLSDTGTLVGQADFAARGDLEFALRRGFRVVPLPQWRDLAQRLSASLGFGGEVSEVTASTPEKTDEPFHFSYKYTRKDFGDWENHHTISPLPLISLAPADEDSLPSGPVWLGPLLDVRCHARMELPAGYRPQLPVAIHAKNDFAEYEVTFDFKDGKLISERHLKTFLPEVPANERAEYIHFMKTMMEDYVSFIPISSTSPTSAAVSKNAPLDAISTLRNLPDSSNEEATRLENQARDSVTKNDMQGAVSSLYRAVSADPKFARAWVLLGSLLLAQKQNDAGIEAFHKAVASAPSVPAIHKALAYSLMATSQFEAAVPVWKEYAKAFPEDVDGPANLGGCFLKLKQYTEATVALEAALKLGGDQANLHVSLGSAYLLAGERDKAAAVFSKLPEVDPEETYFNEVAYQMADADLKLPVALDYAKKAVKKVEQQSQKITLADLTIEKVKDIFTLAAYWDTLGWVNERMTNLEDAELYLRASWKLTQDGAVAGHLCHLYQRVHKFDAASQMCRIAINRLPMSEGIDLNEYKRDVAEAQATLDHLPGASAKSKGVGDASDVVIHEREFKLSRFLPGTESAEFFVLLASDGKSKKFKVEDVKFISGSEKMKAQSKQLMSIDLQFPSPGDVPTRFVRRGILGCYQYTGCSFVLLDPASVHSLN